MCDNYLCDCNYAYSDNSNYDLSCLDYFQCLTNTIVNCICCLPICCYGIFNNNNSNNNNNNDDPYYITLESFNRLDDRYIFCPELYLLFKYIICRCCYDVNYNEYNNSLHGAAISGNYLYFYWLHCCCVSFDVNSNNNRYRDGSLLHLTYSYNDTYYYNTDDDDDNDNDDTTTSSSSSPPSSFSIHRLSLSDDTTISSTPVDVGDDNNNSELIKIDNINNAHDNSHANAHNDDDNNNDDQNNGGNDNSHSNNDDDNDDSIIQKSTNNNHSSNNDHIKSHHKNQYSIHHSNHHNSDPNNNHHDRKYGKSISSSNRTSSRVVIHPRGRAINNLHTSST